MTEKQMHVATIGVMLVVGFLGGYLISEIAPAIRESIPRSCTYQGKTYTSGSPVPSGDSCNSCGCQNGEVGCTSMACGIMPDPEIGPGEGGQTVAITPIPPGQSDMAQKVPDLPSTSISAPPVTVRSLIEHRSALNGKTISVTGVITANMLKQDECQTGQCTLIYRMPSIVIADTTAPSRNPLYDLRINFPPEMETHANAYPVGSTVTVTGLIEGSSDAVHMKFGANGSVTAMTEIYAKEEWYRSQPYEERVLKGTLQKHTEVLAGWRGTLNFVLNTPQGRWLIYGSHQAQRLMPFVGSEVVVQGKLLEGGDAPVELWPAAIGKISP